MAEAIFSEESIINKDQVKQGRTAKVRMHTNPQFRRSVHSAGHNTVWKLKAFLPLSDVLLVACTVLGSNNPHLLPATLEKENSLLVAEGSQAPVSN